MADELKMDVREKLIEILKQAPFEGKVLDEWWWEEKIERIVDHLISQGVTVQEWISVKDRTPTEAYGTVWVCLADVFPYNEKEPYIDAKHDRRITEAFYSQFSKRWYKDGASLPDGVITHWMEKAQPPKGD